LRDLALAFGKPVLFVNGDTHLYKLDKPLADPQTGRPLENFTRVVVFGSPQTKVDTRRNRCVLAAAVRA